MRSTNLYRENPPKGTIGIVIPVRDQLAFFKLAFYSILSFTETPFMLTVVNNMSDFKTYNYLKSIANGNHPINLLNYQKDFNYSAEINMGIRHMFKNQNVEYGMCLNSDVVVEPLWLEKMRARLARPKFGIVGPVSNIAIQQQQFRKQDSSWLSDYVSGFCMLFKREVWEEVGGFSEEYVGGCYEDQDFCMMARQAGWEVAIEGSVYIHHFWKATRSHDPKADSNVLENRNRFLAKFPRSKQEILL